jgi:hypothetical protein
MSTIVHGVAASVALLLAILFWVSTAVSELFLSAYAVVTIRTGILYAIPILVASLVVTGGSGFRLSQRRKGKLIHAKKGRMRLIALNGLLVLGPSALFFTRRRLEGSST